MGQRRKQNKIKTQQRECLSTFSGIFGAIIHCHHVLTHIIHSEVSSLIKASNMTEGNCDIKRNI